MTAAQDKLYKLEWGKVRKIFRETMTPKEADAMRRQLHTRAGVPVSSKDFNNTTDVDKILETFRSISDPARIPDTQAASERRKLIWKIEKLNHDEPYRAAIAHDKFRQCTDWRTLPANHLRQLLITLTSRPV